MTTLVFNHEGYTVATSSWSIAAKHRNENATDICYQWGANGISWFDSSVGNARATLPIPIARLIQEIGHAGGGVADLRRYQS